VVSTAARLPQCEWPVVSTAARLRREPGRNWVGLGVQNAYSLRIGRPAVAGHWQRYLSAASFSAGCSLSASSSSESLCFSAASFSTSDFSASSSSAIFSASVFWRLTLAA